MLEVIEKILAAVIVLAIVSLLIFVTLPHMAPEGAPTPAPNKTAENRGTSPQPSPAPQREAPRPAPQRITPPPAGGYGGGDGRTLEVAPEGRPNGTTQYNPPPRQQQPVQQQQPRQQPVQRQYAPQPVVQEEPGGGSSLWPWNWRWRWPCSGRRDASGNCYHPAVYQPQPAPVYEPPYHERHPYRGRRSYAPPPDERGIYHPEADPYGRYDRDEPYTLCQGDEGCPRPNPPCGQRHGYYRPPQPCGDGCKWRPYWQRESYRASFGYDPYREHWGYPPPDCGD